MAITLLPLTEPDLEDIARIHIQVWREAYVGQVAQAFLDGMTFEERRISWRRRFDQHETDDRYETLLAREDGKAVGFISRGPARDADMLSAAEIYGIYVVRSHWGRGLGFQMFNAISQQLRDHSVGQTYLWVLASNMRARQAYSRWGGSEMTGRERPITIGGETLTELAVRFDLS